MSEVPPPQFTAYPRGLPGVPGGSADKLEALFSGYNGLTTAFVVNIVLGLGLNALFRISVYAYLAGWVVLFAVIVAITYHYNRQIAFGKGWEPKSAIIATVLLALTSCLCCGIFGYIVMQTIAANEIKKYGVKPRFFGSMKRQIRETVERLRAEEAAATPPTPFRTPE